jgi:hypothetical protein
MLFRSGVGLAVVVNRDGVLMCSNQRSFSTHTALPSRKYAVAVNTAARREVDSYREHRCAEEGKCFAFPMVPV